MLFCTAASSARLHAVEHCRLEMLVIDEAAQLKECESNIPLQLPGLRHVVLIGDEKQLPALVKSEVCSSLVISCFPDCASMFVIMSHFLALL